MGEELQRHRPESMHRSVGERVLSAIMPRMPEGRPRPLVAAAWLLGAAASAYLGVEVIGGEAGAPLDAFGIIASYASLINITGIH